MQQGRKALFYRSALFFKGKINAPVLPRITNNAIVFISCQPGIFDNLPSENYSMKIVLLKKQEGDPMKKFQAIIKFFMDEDFMTFVPPHRTYVNYLINKGIIDSYAVSMESHTSWITVNADTKTEVEHILEKSPLYRYWEFVIEELFVYDSQQYRLPALQYN